MLDSIAPFEALRWETVLDCSFTFSLLPVGPVPLESFEAQHEEPEKSQPNPDGPQYR